MKQTFNPEQVFFLLQSLLLKTSSFTTSFRQTLNLIKKEAMLEALETMLDRTLKEQETEHNFYSCLRARTKEATNKAALEKFLNGSY